MRVALAVAVLLAVPVACGDDGGTTSPPPTTGAVGFGEGDAVWLQVETGGGFVPYQYALREFPQAVLFDDGHLVRPVSDPSEDPVPELERALLSEDEVVDLLGQADAVVHGPAVGNPPVTDLPTTTIDLTGPDAEGSLGIYALGFTEGLPSEQAAARQAAADLVDDLASVGEAEPYAPEAWLVLTTPVAGGGQGGPSVPWPLDPSLAAGPHDQGGVCTVVSAEDAAPLLDALDGTDPFTFVEVDGHLDDIALRPVLTGDESCADVEGFEER